MAPEANQEIMRESRLLIWNLDDSVDVYKRQDYGYYRASVDSPQVIVTSGAGTWGPPQRVATDNEVAEILVMLPVRQ